MKIRYFFCLLGILLMLSGCSSSSPMEEEDTSHVTIGSCLEVQNTNSRLTLQSNIDTLAADGLYYASWVIGDAEPYENSEGGTIDLYDAQLYLLLGEFRSSEAAGENMNNWLAAGKENYEILSGEEASFGGQAYSLITYNFKTEDNPYARGISAFGTFGTNAVCIELSCRESFEEDLRTILTDFLNGCSYSAE